MVFLVVPGVTDTLLFPSKTNGVTPEKKNLLNKRLRHFRVPILNSTNLTRCFIDLSSRFVKFTFGVNIRFSSWSGGEGDERRHTSWGLH